MIAQKMRTPTAVLPGEPAADQGEPHCKLVVPRVWVSPAGRPAFRLTSERLERNAGPRLVNVARNVEAALNGR